MRRLLSDLDFRHFGERQPSPKWQRLQGMETMIAGAGAGLVSSTLVCPLDVVKTKLQAQGRDLAGSARQYKGLVDTVTRIWVEEGIRGLYRGLGPTIYGYLPTWAIYFTVYDGVKERLRHHAELSDWISHITSAMTAGATGTIVTNPIWVIKTRFMTQQSEPRYRHTIDAARQIFRTEGLQGFYRGLLPSLIGVTHVAVQFPLYERLKEAYRPPNGGELPSHTILFCSSVSKMIASVITYPHEVLRTRLQIQKVSAISMAASAAAQAHGHGQGQVQNPLAGQGHAPPPPPAQAQARVEGQIRRFATMRQLAVPSTGRTLTPQVEMALGAHHSDRRIGLTLPLPPPPSSSRISFPYPTRLTSSTSSRNLSSTPPRHSTAHPPRPSSSKSNSYRGVVSTFRLILSEDGPRGFYRGLGVNLLRTVPSSAITILSYEVFMRNLTFLTHQHPELEGTV